MFAVACLCLALCACGGDGDGDGGGGGDIPGVLFMIGNEPVTSAEYSYYYGILLTYYYESGTFEYYGVDLDLDLSEQKHPNYDTNWHDFLCYTVDNELHYTIALYKEAMANGYVISETGRKENADYLVGVLEASVESGASMDEYLVEQFGEGMTIDLLTTILERRAMSSEYGEYLRANFDFTDADIEKYYEDHKDNFSQVPDVNTVSYRIIIMSDKQEAQDVLAEFKAGQKTEASFVALLLDHSEEGSLPETEGLYTHTSPDNVKESFNVFETWAFDPARKPGDCDLLEMNDLQLIVYFLSQGEPVWKALSRSYLEDGELQRIQDAYPFSDAPA